MIEKINIGDYFIARDSHGRIWIEWASGEAMVIEESKFEELLDKLWEDNF